MEKEICRRHFSREGIGCVWMFMNSMFDFRHVGPIQKLLMDKKRGSKRIIGAETKVEKQLTSEDVNNDHAEKKSDDQCPRISQSDADSINDDDSEEKFSELIKRLISQSQKDSEVENRRNLEDTSQFLDSKEGSFRDIGTSPVSGDSQRIKDTSSQCTQTIVILKPEPSGLVLGSSPGTHATCNKAKTGRSGSSFILSRIRRKLKSKKSPCNVDALSSDMSQLSCLGEEIEITSSRRHVSDGEETTKDGSEDSKKSMCGIYIAAKKHLSEMLAEGDADVDSPGKEVPRILGKILSLPEFSTPENSPRVTLGHDFVGHQITEKPNTQELSSEDSTRHEETGGLDTGDEEKTVLDSLSEEISSSIIHQDAYVDEEKPEAHDEAEQTQPLEKESCSLPSSSVKMSECQDNATDVPGKSSPVSVLEPFFTDDDTSPKSSVERRLQPRCIKFNEPDSPRSEKDNDVKTRMDDEELVLAYIQAVVKSSELNWEELLVRSFYLEQVLEQALVDDIEFYPTNFCTDNKLLFDCINEVLMEFCGHGPWISFAKPAVRFGPDMENVAEVVQEEVYWYLLPLPSPHTLDQIVRKDLARTGDWMDLRFDNGCIGSETSEIILDELLEEIISSCTDCPSQQHHNAQRH